MQQERTVSTAAVWASAMWALAVLVSLAGTIIVLKWGEEIWARAVGLALFGVELIVVGVAIVLTVRMLLRRQASRLHAKMGSTENAFNLGRDYGRDEQLGPRRR